MDEHTCPVCGYNQLELPPRDYSICACCGTEFGYDDRVLNHRQLRDQWIAAGFPWFDPEEPSPLNWNPVRQLMDADLIQIQAENNTANTEPAVVRVNQSPFADWAYA